MTLTDLLAAVAADCGYDAIPSAVVTARLTRYLNDGYRQLLSMPELAPLRHNTLAFTSAPAQALYGFPQAMQTIDTLVNTTQNVRVRLMTLDQLRAIDPQEVSSGTPTHYVPMGLSPVFSQPQMTGLWAQEVSTLAPTNCKVTLRGILNSGLAVVSDTITLAGAALTRIGAHADYVAVQQFEADTAQHGYIRLVDAAVGGRDLGIIPIGEYSSHYQMIRLWPTPSAADQYLIDGSTNLVDLAETTDVPLIPLDFQDILADFARMREYEYRDDSRYAMAQAAYQEKLKYLRERIMNPPDYRPRVGRIPDRSSNLGSFYPPGRW